MFSVYDPDNWRTSTAVFYALICLMSYIIPLVFRYIQDDNVQIGNYRISRPRIAPTKTYRNKTGTGRNRKKIYLDVLLVGLMLLCVKGFLACGVDILGGYKFNFESASSLSSVYDQSLEIGYRLLNVIVYNAAHDYRVFIFICAAITLLPVLYLVNKYHESIDVPVTLFLYTAIFYFPGFSGMRLYMAASIGLLSADFMRQRKPYKALLCLLIACLFHTSAFCLLLPYVFLFFKQIDKKLAVTCMLAFFCAVYVLKDSFAVMMTGRYANYEIAEEAAIGFQQFAYFIPIYVLLVLCYRIQKDKEESKFAVVYTTAGFVMGLIGYLITILGRAFGLFSYIVFIIGIYIHKVKKVQKKTGIILDIIILAYGFLRFWIYLSGYYVSEGIMPYINIWGMEI